jgi:hypothetical protein
MKLFLLLLGIFLCTLAGSDWRPLLEKLDLPSNSIEAIMKTLDDNLVSVENGKTFSEQDWKNLVPLGLPYGAAIALHRHFNPPSRSFSQTTAEGSLSWLTWTLDLIQWSLVDHPRNEDSYFSCHGVYCLPFGGQLVLVFSSSLLLAFQGSSIVPQGFLFLAPLALCYSLLCRAGWSFLIGTVGSLVFGILTILSRGSLGVIVVVVFLFVPGVVYTINDYFHLCGGKVIFLNTIQLIFIYIMGFPCGVSLRGRLVQMGIGNAPGAARNMC